MISKRVKIDEVSIIDNSHIKGNIRITNSIIINSIITGNGYIDDVVIIDSKLLSKQDYFNIIGNDSLTIINSILNGGVTISGGNAIVKNASLNHNAVLSIKNTNVDGIELSGFEECNIGEW
jgi:NDP-sugar pyrophosphorylase family protein